MEREEKEKRKKPNRSEYSTRILFMSTDGQHRYESKVDWDLSSRSLSEEVRKPLEKGLLPIVIAH